MSIFKCVCQIGPHNHVYTDWKYNPTTKKEESVCLICGLHQIKKEKVTETSIEDLNKIANLVNIQEQSLANGNLVIPFTSQWVAYKDYIMDLKEKYQNAYSSYSSKNHILKMKYRTLLDFIKYYASAIQSISNRYGDNLSSKDLRIVVEQLRNLCSYRRAKFLKDSIVNLSELSNNNLSLVTDDFGKSYQIDSSYEDVFKSFSKQQYDKFEEYKEAKRIIFGEQKSSVQKTEKEDQQWNKMYNLAKKYFIYHGDLKIDQDFKTINGSQYDADGMALGEWINYQKRLYVGQNKAELTEKQIKLLEAIRIRWFDQCTDKEFQKEEITKNNTKRKRTELLNRAKSFFINLRNQNKFETKEDVEKINEEFMGSLNRKR